MIFKGNRSDTNIFIALAVFLVVISGQAFATTYDIPYATSGWSSGSGSNYDNNITSNAYINLNTGVLGSHYNYSYSNYTIVNGNNKILNLNLSYAYTGGACYLGLNITCYNLTSSAWNQIYYYSNSGNPLNLKTGITIPTRDRKSVV